MQVLERKATSGRVDTQMAQASDIGGQVYGGTLIEGKATVAEALELSGLNWEVELKQAEYNGKPVAGRFWTVRTDTNTAIDVVGKRYNPIQNRSAFAFIDRLVGEGAACIASAGSLYGGRMVWINLDLGDFDVVPGDSVKKFMVMANVHDTSAHLRIKNAPGRLECQNALDYVLAGDNSGLMQIPHVSSAIARLDQAHRVIERAHNDYEALEKMFRDWSHVHVDSDEVDLLVRQVLGVSEADLLALENDEFERQPHWVNQRIAMKRLVYQGAGVEIPGVKGTLWNCFNGINGYYDHGRTIKGEKDNPDVRLESRLFGTSSDNKRRAFEVCRDYALSLN